jgi:hypothetical protein
MEYALIQQRLARFNKGINKQSFYKDDSFSY